MRFATITLAGALAMSGTCAFAQMGGGNGAGADLPEFSDRGTNQTNLQGGIVNGGSERMTTGMAREPRYRTTRERRGDRGNVASPTIGANSRDETR